MNVFCHYFRSVITRDAIAIFYFQLLDGTFLVVILYLFVCNYQSDRRGCQSLNCFEAPWAIPGLSPHSGMYRKSDWPRFL